MRLKENRALLEEAIKLGCKTMGELGVFIKEREKVKKHSPQREED